MTLDDRLIDLLVRWEEAGGGITPEALCRECPADLPAFRDLLARLGRVGLVPENDTGPPPAGFPAGRYVTRGFHAGGGQGWVYLAHDPELDRVVAVKVRNDAGSGDRFRAEAELTGRLTHPGVVPVHGRGRTGAGREFYAMRFVDGPTLRDAARRFHDEPPADPADRNVELRRLVRAVAAVCETVAYAHSQRVIHRDLKPANVMLGSFGEVLVMDWGLAKEVRGAGSDEETAAWADPASAPAPGPLVDETRIGSVKGSPAYMSPEQARGDWAAVGPSSDVYSLGATLYYVLSGRPPFDGPTGPEVVRRVREGAFPAPLAVNPAVPPALDAVCRKAMATRPTDRYPSARDFAADLDRWLADEPVGAWREPRAVRARRWVRRHRQLVAGAVAALAVGLAAAVLVAVLQHEANVALGRANGDLDAANDGLVRTNADLVEANGRESAAKTDALAQKARADASLVRTRTTLHAVRMNAVATALAGGQSERAWALVRASLPEPGARDDPRGFEWFHAWHLFARPPECVVRGPATPVALTISTDGRRLAVRTARELTLYDLPGGTVLKAIGDLPWQNEIAASADLTLVAVPESNSQTPFATPGTAGVRLWHIPRDGPAKWGRRLTLVGKGTTAQAVSADGRRVAAAGLEGRVVVWDAGTGDPVYEYNYAADGRSFPYTISKLRLSPDAALLGLVPGAEVQIHDLARKTRFTPAFRAEGFMHDVWFTAAGSAIVENADGTIDGQPASALAPARPVAPVNTRPEPARWGRPLPGSSATRVWERIEPDGGVLTVFAGDGLVRPYFAPPRPQFVFGVGFPTGTAPAPAPTRPGNPLPLLSPFPDPVAAFAVSHGGKWWAAAAPDGTVTVFPVPTPADLGLLVPHASESFRTEGVGFTAGGQLVTQAHMGVVCGPPAGPVAWRWDPPPQKGPAAGLSIPPASLGVSPDGTRVAYRVADGLRVVDAKTGEAIGLAPVRRLGLTSPEVRVAFVPGRPHLVYANPTRAPKDKIIIAATAAEMVVWDYAEGKALATWPVPAWVRDVAVSADGRRIIAAAEDGCVRVWDAGRAGGEPTRVLRTPDTLWSVAVAPDGRIAAGGHDGAVWVWAGDRAEPTRSPAHRKIVRSVAFAPDGRSLVSGSDDGLRFLDLELMQERFAVPIEGGVGALAFSPDGRALAVGGAAGTVRLYRTTTPEGVVETCRRRAAGSADRRDLVAALWTLYMDRARARDRAGARHVLEEAIRAAEAAGDRADAVGWRVELRAALATTD